jgi:hypothetical protein
MTNFIAKSLLIFIASASSLAGPADSGTDQLRYLEESRGIAKAFMQALGGTLKKQLEAGGAESALSICKHIAPAMAAEYSKDGRVVKRVSLKNRNPLMGLPDEWEREVLEDFDRDYRDGKPAAEIEKIAIVQDPDGRWFRYMKAIPTQPICRKASRPYWRRNIRKTRRPVIMPAKYAARYRSSGACSHMLF